MRIEKREDLAFMAHSGLAIFFKKKADAKTGEQFFSCWVNVSEGEGENRTWKNVGNMTLSIGDYRSFVGVLEALRE